MQPVNLSEKLKELLERIKNGRIVKKGWLW